jgi:hypothetical protein
VSFQKIVLVLSASALLAQAAPAQDPLANQRLADEVAHTLQQSGKLKNYHVDIEARGGTVELHGKVADLAQRDLAVLIARSVPGVRHVSERLLVLNERSIVPVQGDDQPEVGPPPAKMDLPLPAPSPVPALPEGPAVMPSCPFDPMPFNPNCPNDMFMRPPVMPPYAWPTYAPYNNYSRVAYPTLYPADAFPGIGPFYPFPKVPLGWRSVQLTWQDGYWWYGKGVTGHDWWRIRYK